MTLFRPEVFRARQNRWTGQIILTRPFSLSFLTFCTAVFAAVLLLFAAFVSQTPAQFQVQVIDTSDADTRQFCGIGGSQIQSKQQQDLAKFGLGNFTELLDLFFKFISEAYHYIE